MPEEAARKQLALLRSGLGYLLGPEAPRTRVVTRPYPQQTLILEDHMNPKLVLDALYVLQSLSRHMDHKPSYIHWVPKDCTSLMIMNYEGFLLVPFVARL